MMRSSLNVGIILNFVFSSLVIVEASKHHTGLHVSPTEAPSKHAIPTEAPSKHTIVASLTEAPSKRNALFPTEAPSKHSISTSSSEAPSKHTIVTSLTEAPSKHGNVFFPTESPTQHGLAITTAPSKHGISSSPTAAHTSKEESSSLWDLIVDPTETNNLYLKSSYKTIRDHLKARMSYWQDTLLPTDDDSSNDGSDLMAAAYKQCGGVCPYVNDTYTRLIEQIYFPENPPHIVFVLVDDWGYNDIGLRSTYMNWTTPTIDKLAGQGIMLENYFAHSFCVPTRAALMTGRFAGRLGLLDDLDGEMSLPVTEVTLAQELKSAGYETHLVGKWDLGHSSYSRLPTYRGFDSFFGYYSGFIDYYTKSYGIYLDLQEQDKLVTSETYLSKSYHSAFLFEKKAETVILNHAMNNPTTPMFLYYALQLVHSPYEAPLEYVERCAGFNIDFDAEDEALKDYQNYCAMNLMLDEVIANLTCVLKQANMLDNTVFILASDNGGAEEIPGDSLPFRGHKYNFNRGGISVTGFVASELIPEDRRGSTYSGQMHVSDWLPTIMGLATEGEWTGGYTGAVIDGVDMWDAIIENSTSPRYEIPHYVNQRGQGSMQFNMVKYDMKIDPTDYDEVKVFFPSDYAPELASYRCDDPSILLGSPTESPTPVSPPIKVLQTGKPTSYISDEPTESPTPVSLPVKVLQTGKPTSYISEELTESPTPVSPPIKVLQTGKPTSDISEEMTHWPTDEPTNWPTQVVKVGSAKPTHWPTKHPTDEPTDKPTHWPTKHPTDEPTDTPTHWPTKHPIDEPTDTPTHWPTKHPTDEPTDKPIHWSTNYPTDEPTNWPTQVVKVGSAKPTHWPTKHPTDEPTDKPTSSPTVMATHRPSAEPSTDSNARSHQRTNSHSRHKSSPSSSSSSSRKSSDEEESEKSHTHKSHHHRSLSSLSSVALETAPKSPMLIAETQLSTRIFTTIFSVHGWVVSCVAVVVAMVALAAVLTQKQLNRKAATQGAAREICTVCTVDSTTRPHNEACDESSSECVCETDAI